jgi:hypothetical protein
VGEEPPEVEAGEDGVNVDGCAARQEDAAEAAEALLAGAEGFTVAFPAKLQDWALRLVAS